MPCTSPGQGQRQVLASAACRKGRGDACSGGQKGVRLRMVRQGAQLRVTASDPSGSQAPRMLEIPIDSFVDEAEGGLSHFTIPCHAKHQELCATRMGLVCACSAQLSQPLMPNSPASSH